MIKYDFHIHTEYSYDSRIKGNEMMDRALELGYDELAITEHVDLLPQELSVFGLPSLKKYQAYVNKLREQYPSITLHCGIELGDYHLVNDFATGLICGFDFFPILGSVHFLTDHTNVAIPFPSPLSTAQILDYYENNLRLVSECDIDVLAHLGVYKRYYNNVPDESFATSLIKDIFAVMIDKGIALELNFSGLFKPYASVIPEPHFIELYRGMGGRLFSLGSDTHRLENFGSTLLGSGLIGDHLYPTNHRHP